MDNVGWDDDGMVRLWGWELGVLGERRAGAMFDGHEFNKNEVEILEMNEGNNDACSMCSMVQRG